MSEVPQSIIEHCSKHRLCRGCPLGTCVAPVGVSVTDPRWQQWIDSIAARLREGGA